MTESGRQKLSSYGSLVSRSSIHAKQYSDIPQAYKGGTFGNPGLPPGEEGGVGGELHSAGQQEKSSCDTERVVGGNTDSVSALVTTRCHHVHTHTASHPAHTQTTKHMYTSSTHSMTKSRLIQTRALYSTPVLVNVGDCMYSRDADE